MAILQRCCFMNIRQGCFASAVYCTIFYTVSLVLNGLAMREYNLFWPSYWYPLLMVVQVTASISIVVSLILLLGLLKNNPPMLLPFVFGISITTVIDIIAEIYILAHPTTGDEARRPSVRLISYFVFRLLNVFCILCVISQYQHYKEGTAYQASGITPGRVIAPPPTQVLYSMVATNVAPAHMQYNMVPTNPPPPQGQYNMVPMNPPPPQGQYNMAPMNPPPPQGQYNMVPTNPPPPQAQYNMSPFNPGHQMDGWNTEKRY